MYTLAHIASVVKAQTVSLHESTVSVLLTDSRQLSDPSSTLFVALVSRRNDGHRFILSLYEQGVRSFLVQQIPENAANLRGAAFLIVPDTLKALQQLASWHRSQFHIPVIGITGSNGKTIVKEWLYQLLKDDYTICRSPKSYNSQIGVPLSVWQLNPKHTLAIFEAGISEPGEMPALEAMIRPSLGVFTTLGPAHDEGFSSPQEKLREKLALFAHSETLVANAIGHPEIVAELPDAPARVVISERDDATLQLIQTKVIGHETLLTAQYHKQDISITIPFSDQASVQNAATCWATLLALGYDNTMIARRMRGLSPVALRLEIKQGINNSVLINDFYNSDLHSLSIALHYLDQQHRGGKKVVVLSDIEQSGKSHDELYADVAQLLQQHHVDLLIGIGKHLSSYATLFTMEHALFEDTAAFTARLNSIFLQVNHATILLKGSRSFGFEAISTLLQQKSHDTVLEINLNHLIHNINFYKAQLQPRTRLMCMVKATGYGSGSSEIAFTLQHHGVDYLAVAYADEGVDLRKAGIHLPIMVMNPEEHAFDDIIQYSLEPEIFSQRVLDEFVKALQKQAISTAYPIHIKLDTGMHRLGFEEKQITDLVSVLKSEPSILVKSVFSHLVASDSAAFDGFTHMQIALFEKMSAQIEEGIGYSFLRHICNSGAITRFRNAQYDMVRLGIGMYGVGFNELEKKNLVNVNALKTRISQIKHLQPGDTVGYNRSGKIDVPTTIATIPIGYADGFSRKLGNGHFSVRIGGVACKTVGNICMDMCMVNVTGLPCQEGDEVIIFETNEQLEHLSSVLDTIPYEVLTSVSTRVKRVYVQE